MAGVALVLAAGGCADGREPAPPAAPPLSPSGQARPDTPIATPTSRATSPTGTPALPSASAGGRPATALGRWRVGARPLPLRADGFGAVLPTPAPLRVRRLATRDLLPPPPDEQFHATVAAVTPAVRRRMGETWSPSCPVGLSRLRYVTVTFRGFDDRPHTGELVVGAAVADDVVEVFSRLYAAAYPIEEMRLPTTADLEAPPTGDGNNTASYVCRTVRGSTAVSAHASGLAIDVNPFMNPYHRGDLVLPELASAYLDRDWQRPGMVRPGGPVTRAFAGVGWAWGGGFRSVSDPMHFTRTGR